MSILNIINYISTIFRITLTSLLFIYLNNCVDVAKVKVFIDHVLSIHVPTRDNLLSELNKVQKKPSGLIEKQL